MWSRRYFLRHCAAASAGLLWATGARADEKAEEKKVDPLLTKDAQKAIASGLKYLKDKQNKDGSFGTAAYKGNVGITSLCGLAMLAGGHRPGAGAYGPALDSALDFVLGKEDPREKGFLHNAGASPHGPMYNHGFGVVFLAAAHGKVRDKKRAGKLQEVLERAVALTLKSQNAQKGWRYLPTSKDSDLTVTAGQLHALRVARDTGIGVPKAALDGGAGYVKKCQDRDGGFRYMTIGGTANWGRTGAGLLALYCAGVTRGAEVDRALKYLLDHLPDPKAPRKETFVNFGNYYATLATWAAGGDARKKWYEAARDELIATQTDDGNWKDTVDPHCGTAEALIALQAPGGLLSPEF